MNPAQKDTFMEGLEAIDPLPWMERDRAELSALLRNNPTLSRALSRVLAAGSEVLKPLSNLNMSIIPEANIKAAAIQGHARGVTTALETLADLAMSDREEQEDAV